MQTSKNTSLKLIPSATQIHYKDFKEINDISSSSNYRTYHAISKTDGQLYMIRVLNLEGELYKKNRNQSVTLYLQDLLYLCTRFGRDHLKQDSDFITNADILDFKNFQVEGECMAFVMKEVAQMRRASVDWRPPTTNSLIDTEKKLKNVHSEIKSILSQLGVEVPDEPEEAEIPATHTETQKPHIQIDLLSEFRSPTHHQAAVSQEDTQPVEVESPHAHLHPKVAEILLDPNPLGIKQIGLSLSGIKEEEALALGRNTTWVNLKELYLFDNHIGDVGAQAIGANTTWKSLKILALNANSIGDDGAVGLGSNTVWECLEELYLFDNQIGDKGASAIGGNNVWRSLKKLVLQQNKIGDEGACGIGANTSWVNLEELELSINQIGDKGAMAIGSNSAWKNLKQLDMSLNTGITKKGTTHLKNNPLFGSKVLF